MNVYVMNTNDNSYRTVYEYVETLEEVDLLAQLAMVNKRQDELVFVFPGFNRGINKNKAEYEKALELAEKYKPDYPERVCRGDDQELKRIKEKMHRYVDML